MIPKSYKDEQAFITRLQLYESRLKSKIAVHLPLLSGIASDSNFYYPIEINKMLTAIQKKTHFPTKISTLITNIYASVGRLGGKRQHIFANQDNRSSVEYRVKTFLEKKGKIEFYKECMHEDNFPYLKQWSRRMTAAMPTTCECESCFSKLKIVKWKNHNKLTDENMTKAFTMRRIKICHEYKKRKGNCIQKQVLR